MNIFSQFTPFDFDITTKHFWNQTYLCNDVQASRASSAFFDAHLSSSYLNTPVCNTPSMQYAILSVVRWSFEMEKIPLKFDQIWTSLGSLDPNQPEKKEHCANVIRQNIEKTLKIFISSQFVTTCSGTSETILLVAERNVPY